MRLRAEGVSISNHKSTISLKLGAIEGTRTPTPLPVHGPEPCASANSATMASGLTLQRRPQGRRIRKTYVNILQAQGHVSNQRLTGLLREPQPALSEVEGCP